MRRIMIAHRNNLKEHAVLKRAMREADAARAAEGGGLAAEGNSSTQPGRRNAGDATTAATEGGQNDDDDVDDDRIPDGTTKMAHATSASSPPAYASSSTFNGKKDDNDAPPPSSSSSSSSLGTGMERTRRMYGGSSAPPKSDEDILREMDVDAVETTRSYRRWTACPDGTTFTYNHTYVKGVEGHDWLLRKNIWRRMRYRRENRVKVLNLMAREIEIDRPDDCRQRLLVVSRAVEDAAAAAVARADSYDHAIDADAVAALGAVGGEEDDPSTGLSGVLDAAARLAAAVSVANGATLVKSGEANGGIFEV